MKAFLAVLALAVAVSAEADSGYGSPSYTPQVHRHVYVHAAPDEAPDHQSRTIRVPGGDKHVNIIFVRTPSSSSSHNTEVILPEQDQHRNLVYVLLKKGSSTSDVKIRRPAAQGPQRPEVYFIRYGGSSGYGGAGGAGGAGIIGAGSGAGAGAGIIDGGFGGGAGAAAVAPQPVRAASSAYGL